MTYPKARLVVVLTLLCAAADAQLPDLPDLPASEPSADDRVPTFTSKGYRLRWLRMECEAEVQFGEPDKTRYELDLEGRCFPPPAVDAVAISKKITVESASERGGDNALKPVKTFFRPSVDYNAFLPDGAEVEVDGCKLTCRPHRVRSIELTGTVILALKRETMELPAAVMVEDRQLGGGLKIRIVSLRMNSQRELTVQVN